LNKLAASILILIALMIATVTIEPADAQAIPDPSIPQFSIQVVDYSYDVPTTYSTDSYTGKQITIPGYHVEDIRIEGKIKNQPFTPNTIPNPSPTSSYNANLKIDFYYNISYKGHFGSDWRKLFGSEDVDYLMQNYGSEYTFFNASRYNAIEFRDGDVVDFQVKAIIGYETWGFVSSWPYRILNGKDSGWSSTLTVTISKDAASSNTFATSIDNSPYPALSFTQQLITPTPTSIISGTSPTPSVPELSWIIILPLLLLISIVPVALRKRIFRQCHNFH
jgi:hypothetical protein